jgi:signal transduction histidine kinase
MKRKTGKAGAAGAPERGCALAAQIYLGLGACAALAGLVLWARRIAPGPFEEAVSGPASAGMSPALAVAVHRAELIDNALMARLAIKARFAREAHAIDHDLRGPIGAMAVSLELLRTAKDNATRDEVADVLQRQVTRMTTLTQRVHDLAQQLGD